MDFISAGFRQQIASGLSRISRAMASVLLGRLPAQRRRLFGTLITMAAYWTCVPLLWLSVTLGMSDPWGARLVTPLLVINPCLFYAVIRSGITHRLPDPAMVMLQMMAAMIVLILGYALNPTVRSLTLLMVAMVMAFAMFSLTPVQARRLAIFILVAYGSLMSWLGWRWPSIFDPRKEFANFLILAAVVPTMSSLTSQVARLRNRLEEQRTALQAALVELELLASHDSLTGLINRRFMVDRLLLEQHRLHAEAGPVCIGLIDLDHFKRINDLYGHAAGDETLRRFGQQARRCVRQTDLVARWGGEEFLLLLPGSNLLTAEQVMTRLRNGLAEKALWQDRPELKVTVSIGVAQWHPGEAVDHVVERADRLAYQAKNAGRDRVMYEQTVSAEAS